MKEPKTPPALPYLYSLPSVIFLVVVLVVVWIGLNISHYYLTKSQIRRIFDTQAAEMANLLVLGEQSMAEVLERLEKEQAARFLAIGFRLRDMEEKEPLTLERMESVAEESDLINVFIFDGEGNRELALRGGPGSRRPPWAGQGGGRGP
ncbi:MAG: hypothetical protein RBU29_14620, partial [bacterium]|nr:hypothetical protein [bacterium]